MNKKVVTGIIVVVLIGAGYFVYQQFFGGGDGEKKAKESDVDYLRTKGYTKYDVSSLGRDFVSAWAKGAKNGDEFFGYEGKTYRVQGGKAVN